MASILACIWLNLKIRVPAALPFEAAALEQPHYNNLTTTAIQITAPLINKTHIAAEGRKAPSDGGGVEGGVQALSL